MMRSKKKKMSAKGVMPAVPVPVKNLKVLKRIILPGGVVYNHERTLEIGTVFACDRNITESLLAKGAVERTTSPVSSLRDMQKIAKRIHVATRHERNTR